MKKCSFPNLINTLKSLNEKCCARKFFPETWRFSLITMKEVSKSVQIVKLLDGTLNAYTYKKLLEDNLLPELQKFNNQMSSCRTTQGFAFFSKITE